MKSWKKVVYYGDRVIRHPLFITSILLFLFVYFAIANAQFQKDNRQILNDTRRSAENTEKLLESQKDILEAIKQVTEDTKITAEQQTAIIICMLQVEVHQRSTDLLNGCRDQAVTNTSRESTSTAPAQPSPQQRTAPSTPSGNPNQPETPAEPPDNPNFLQRTIRRLGDILGI